MTSLAVHIIMVSCLLHSTQYTVDTIVCKCNARLSLLSIVTSTLL